MASLRGLQMIFTRVEPEYSPQRKSGFQTVYYSPALPAADVKQIEKRVQCFQSNDPSLVRWQFFTLDGGSVVLTHSITIESHPQIVDRNRRSGVFLAHCLIFRREDFQRWAHNDPFRIFDRFGFVRDAVTLVEWFNQAEGREPRCDFDGRNLSESSANPRWRPEAVRLAGLAEQAPALKAHSQSILLHGSPYQIGDLLRAIFYWAPRRTRLQCSFDTHIERCMTPAGLYWAVGLPGRASGWPVIIDAGTYRVNVQGPALNASDMYLAWLQQAAVADRPEAAGQAPVIEELSEAFQTVRFPARIVTEDESACVAFFALHEGRVMQNLRVALGKATSPAVGNLLADYMVRTGARRSELLGVAAAQGVSSEWLEWLASHARSWVLGHAPEFAGLKRSEWKAFQDLAQRARDPVLLFWAAALGDERHLREQTLNQMDDTSFRSALGLLFKPLIPASFVAPRHIQVLLEAVRPFARDMEDESFIEFTKAVIAAGGAAYLDRLADRVAILENRGLTRLEKELQKAPGVAEGFLRAAAGRREEIGPPASLLGTLAGLPTKLLGGQLGPAAPVEQAPAESHLTPKEEVPT